MGMPEVIDTIGLVVTIIFGGGYLYIYNKQADIADTANLMTLWQEHNRIFAKINDIHNNFADSDNKVDKLGLIYFDLIMLFERCCTFYFEARNESKTMQVRFHALFDEAIEANLRKHFKKAFNSSKVNFIYEYGLINLHKYCIKREIIFENNLGHINDKPTNIINLIDSIGYNITMNGFDAFKLSKYIDNLENKSKSIKKKDKI